MPRFVQSIKSLPTARWRQGPSVFARVNLTGHRWTWIYHLCCKLITIAALVAAISIGAISRVFAVKTKDFLVVAINSDLQLSLFGLINKILDLVVTKALQVTAGILVTFWMTRSTTGVQIGDFELGEELTKPWAAILKFHGRWLNNGWRNAGWLRIAIALSVSISVLFQGFAIVTIAVPKERWYTNTSIAYPRMELHGLDWASFYDDAFMTVGASDNIWATTSAYTAISAFRAFRKFHFKYTSMTPGWQTFDDESNEYAALDTRFDNSSARGVAVHAKQQLPVLEWMQKNGSGSFQHFTGLSGTMKFTMPSMSASCQLQQYNSTVNHSRLDGASVVVDRPYTKSDLNTEFLVHLFPDNLTDSGSVTCKAAFHRIIFPVSVGFVEETVLGQGYSEMSINGWGQDFNISPEILPVTSIDSTIVDALVTQLQGVSVHLDSLVPGMTGANWLLYVGRQRWKDSQSNTPRSEADAVAPTVALLTNQLLALSNWNTTLNESEQFQASVQLKLFGSGPRTKWVWSAVAILAILALTLSVSVVISICLRIVPGEWLRAGGMLVAANCSSPITGLEAALDKPQHELESMRFGVRQTQQAKKRNVAAFVAGDPLAGPHVNLKGVYHWS